MANLTAERDTRKKHRHYAFAYKMKGNVKIFSGGGVCADAGGYAVKAADTASYKTLGRANQTQDTTAAGPDGLKADGDVYIEAEHGIFAFATSGGSAITVADVGGFAYWLDDQTVVKAAGTSNSIKAGTILGLDPDTGQVWVDTLIDA